jgi:hypothetical protein
MIQRFTGQLPLWARTDHPMLRYELARAAGRVPRRAKLFRAFWIVLIGLLLAGGGYLIATGFLRQPPGQNLTESAMNVVFWPLLLLQILMSVVTLALTGSTVAEEVRRQTWDNLRATQSGAELTIRTRWAAVFYRIRGLIGAVLVVRVLLILGILYDLTAFQGRYLDLLINGIVPDVPLPAAALLLAFMMTASLLLPVTAVGFDAAIGLLIATIFQQRTYAVLAQVLYIVFRLTVVGALVFGTTQFINGNLPASDPGAWLLAGGFAALGDWGLAFLNLGFFGEIWATIPYGIFLGLALLVFSLGLAALTDAVVALAVRQAEQRG